MKFQNMFRSCKTLLLFIVIVLILISCIKQKKHDYRVKVQYFNSKYDTTFIDRRNGIVAFNFLGLFKNDTLYIKVNNQGLIKEVLNTHEITGNALIVEIDSLKNIEEIRLKINNGDEVIVKCDHDNQIFVATQKDNTLMIKAVKSFKSGE
jgi:hypothetical protein